LRGRKCGTAANQSTLLSTRDTGLGVDLAASVLKLELRGYAQLSEVKLARIASQIVRIRKFSIQSISVGDRERAAILSEIPRIMSSRCVSAFLLSRGFARNWGF
jgi:hypothetical protein